jgi:hypothetical protein
MEHLFYFYDRNIWQHKEKKNAHCNDTTLSTDSLLTGLCCAHERTHIHKCRRYTSCPQHAEAGVASNYNCAEMLDDKYDTGKGITVNQKSHRKCFRTFCMS